MLYALIAVSWVLLNTWVSMVFVLSTSNIDIYDLPYIFLMAIFTPVPVYIIVQLIRKPKKYANRK